MIYPLVGELAAEGIAVTLIRRVLGFSPHGFYRWKANPVTDRDWADAHLINAALDIHDGAPEFGYRLVADELGDHGITAGENRMAGTSPPGPFRCGSTTCNTNPAVPAASKALPPSSSARIADCEAIQWVEEAIPKVPCNVGRVVKVMAGSQQGR